MQKITICIILLFSISLWGETPILILNSYHEEYSWTKNQKEGFVSVINKVPGVYPLCSTEYLDTKRRGFSEEYESDYVNYIKSKYDNYKPKLIYVTDDDALHFVLHNREKLFPSAPVVFSGINSLFMIDKFSNSPSNGVFEKRATLPNLKLIKTLFPSEHEVILLGDASSSAQMLRPDIENDLHDYHDLKINYLFNKDFESILEALQTYRGKTVILTSIGAFHARDGHRISVAEVISEIKKIKNFFIISLESSYIKNGVAGGYAVDGLTQGEKAGNIALKIMQHPNTPLPKPLIDSGGWIFDVQVLKQQGVKLPAEIAEKSKLINVPETFYQKHEELITNLIYLLSAVIFIGTISFIVLLLYGRKRVLNREKLLNILSERLNTAQSITHLGNWEWDIESGDIWWSDEVYRIFGLEPQQFKATYELLLEYIHPDDKTALQTAVDSSLATHTDYHIIHRIIRTDNRDMRYVLEEGKLKYDLNGKPVIMIGTIHDITEEHKKEEELLLQAQIFNAVQDSIIVHDVDGKILYINDNAYKTRGYTKEEMMAMTIKELDAPEYTSGNPEIMKETLTKIQKDGFMRIEVEHMCKDGRRLPVEIFAKSITLNKEFYILSSVRDISERKQAQLILESSEKKYRDLIETSMVGVYRSNMLGTILYANSYLANMLGYDTKEILEQKCSFVYKDPQQRERFIQKITDNGSVSNYEIDLIDKNGVNLPILVSATLEKDILSGMIIDMREIERSRKEIDKLSKVIEQIDDSVVITNRDGVIIYVNPAFSNHTGFTKEDALGKTPRITKSNDYGKDFYVKLWQTVLAGDVYRGVLTNKSKDGTIYYEDKTITSIKDDHGKIVGFVSTGRDVTQETLKNQEIQRMASTDQLTGAYSRHKFEELFIIEAERSRRFNIPLSLILIDIDHFKVVNDTYGHDIGDMVLVKLANIIQENIRKIDVFARWGGEEFLILCPETSIQKVKLLAEKLRLAVQSTNFEKVDHTTISSGISTCGENDSFNKLFKRADRGLYYAKEHGRNQVGMVLK